MAAPRTPSPPDPRAIDRDRLRTLLRPHRDLLRACGLDLPDPGAAPGPVDRLAAVLVALGTGAAPDRTATRPVFTGGPAPPLGKRPPADPVLEGNNLGRFWHAVDTLPGGVAPAAEWARQVGSAVDLIRPFLRPVGPGAPTGWADGGEHEVDRGRLVAGVADALGVAPAGPPGPTDEAVRWVGRVTVDGIRTGCFLAFPSADADAHVLAARLIATGHAPFVLLPPTRRWVSRPVGPVLRRAGCRLVPLDAVVCAVRPGQLWPLIPVDAVVGQTTGPPAGVPAADRSEPATFRWEGDGWWVRFAGQTAVVRDERGVRYLAHLLRTKGRAVRAATLRAAAREQPMDHPFPGVEVTDEAAAAYRAARDALTGELEAARTAGDVARFEDVQDRLDRVTAELRAADGFGDRPRRVGDEVDRARTAVKNALDRAIGRIGKWLPALARHLAVSIRTGRSVCYDPHPDVDWVV